MLGRGAECVKCAAEVGQDGVVPILGGGEVRRLEENRPDCMCIGIDLAVGCDDLLKAGAERFWVGCVATVRFDLWMPGA